MITSKNQKIPEEELSASNNIIGKGTTLAGNIESYGNIRIEGKIIGGVKSKSKIALGQSSYVEGDILTQNAEIAGEVKGKIEISELLILKPSAVINGDIITNKIVVESGAVFNGSCKMGVFSAEINIAESEKQNTQID
ncbi:polymer-forming cytoskeletal protein [Bacteroidota bacterium]